MKFSMMCLTAMLVSGSAFALNDGDMVKALQTVNMGEISMATMAKQKSKNPEVMKFADHMITDHKMNNEKTAMLLKDSKIVPTENEKAQALDKEGMTTMQNLSKLSGNAFDSAYIAAQLKMHKEVLATIDNEFLPKATNAGLKEHLKKTRDTVAMHAKHAEQLQTTMK